MSVLWILGEARSGKSELAEEIFARLPGPKAYIGTLPRTPENMETICKHVERRPKDWELVEITDSLDMATEAIERMRQHKAVAVLLDGWGVYARQRAGQWEEENADPGPRDETRFIEDIRSELRRLVSVCDHVVIVAHVAAQAPTRLDHESDRVSWRVRAVTNRCMAEADHVIYHDAEEVGPEDTSRVKQIAGQMITGA